MDPDWISKAFMSRQLYHCNKAHETQQCVLHGRKQKCANPCRTFLVKGRWPPLLPQKSAHKVTRFRSVANNTTGGRGVGWWNDRVILRDPSCVCQATPQASVSTSSKLNLDTIFRLIPIVPEFFNSWQKCYHHQGMFWKADSKASHRVASLANK